MPTESSNKADRERYLFGDTDFAARRLELLAHVFAPPTRALLLDAGVGAVDHAIDLGCGPGHTTRLIAEALQCKQISGLDNSQHFISMAGDREIANVSFRFHDVTRTPFPTGQADLLYCRFLITHLAQPEAAISDWATQLQLDGYLLMEETEWIETSLPLFTDYISMTEATLASQSNDLYPGPLLDQQQVTQLTKRLSRVYRHSVTRILYPAKTIRPVFLEDYEYGGYFTIFLSV